MNWQVWGQALGRGTHSIRRNSANRLELDVQSLLQNFGLDSVFHKEQLSGQFYGKK